MRGQEAENWNTYHCDWSGMNDMHTKGGTLVMLLVVVLGLTNPVCECVFDAYV